MASDAASSPAQASTDAGPGGLRREGGQQQHAGAEDGAHVERGARGDAEAGGSVGSMTA